jgi:hypothetical protein
MGPPPIPESLRTLAPGPRDERLQESSQPDSQFRVTRRSNACEACKKRKTKVCPDRLGYRFVNNLQAFAKLFVSVEGTNPAKCAFSVAPNAYLSKNETKGENTHKEKLHGNSTWPMGCWTISLRRSGSKIFHSSSDCFRP